MQGTSNGFSSTLLRTKTYLSKDVNTWLNALTKKSWLQKIRTSLHYSDKELVILPSKSKAARVLHACLTTYIASQQIKGPSSIKLSQEILLLSAHLQYSQI